MSEVEAVKNKFVFQPEDDHGRPWGPPISINYADDAELAEALEVANADVVSKLAAQKLKKHVDVYPDAPKYDGSADQAQIEAEALKFQQSTPEYDATPTSFQAMVVFMQKHNLAPVAENWKLAFDALVEIGVLVPAKRTGPVQKHTKALTMADIDAMPADVYKRRLLGDADFREHVESLYR